MDMQKKSYENISALADGELAPNEVELAFATLETPGGRVAWNAYHQIGHVLRSDACGFDLSEEFSARLAARLAAEASAKGGPGADPEADTEQGGAAPLGIPTLS